MSRAKSNNRSNAYEHIYWELSYNHEDLQALAEPFHHQFQDHSLQREELADIRDQLRMEYWRLIDQVLTKRQAAILKLVAAGWSQVEIAKMRGVTQGTIVKSMIGSPDVKRNVMYGGSFKKLREAIKTDTVINELIARMRELNQEIDE